nr:uncharacterized protein LOC113404107 [Vanessa tameamea]
MFLADRLTSTNSGRTIGDTRPTSLFNRSDNGEEPTTTGEVKAASLESWGWADKIAHRSLEERELINKSWRAATKTTYKTPIQRWILWCIFHRIDPKMLQAIDVARFLNKIYLKDGLAYRTVLLHKSAVSTYCGLNNLSKKIFINQILKAISLERPQERKTPIWDTSLLFEWLKDTPNCNTIFDIVRKTAIILLLASGRRIHDLTLLDVSEV